MPKQFSITSFIALILPFCFVTFSQAVTIETHFGETVEFSLSNVTDSDIVCSPDRDIGTSWETIYCYAPMYEGAPVEVNVDVTNLVVLPDVSGSQRRLRVSIPDNGTRWVAEKLWLASSGQPQPTAPLNLRHKATLRPYQREPAYPGFQADKKIFIEDAFVNLAEGPRFINILILPSRLVGLENSEDNGLPRHAKTEPDFETKEPYGCNGCSDMGLPGYRVNMSNLKPTVQDTLFAWEGLGPNVALQLAWNSGLRDGYTDFGSGWRFSYDSWLHESSEGVTVSLDSGGQTSFNIPTGGNANFTGVDPLDPDIHYLEYATMPVGTPNYDGSWDGKFEKDNAGFHLEKDLVVSGIRRFKMSSPTYGLTYIFEGSTVTTVPIPLVAVEDRNGNRMVITRNGSGGITSITDAAGRSVALSYDGSGRCTTITVPGGNQMTFGYTGGNLTRTVDLIGNETLYSYDTNNNVTLMNTEGRMWSFIWGATDEVPHLISTIDPEGKSTDYSITDQTFDWKQTAMTTPDGQTVTYDYPKGRYKTNSRERRPTVRYDEKGKVVEVESIGGKSKLLEYNSAGLISQKTEYNTGIHQYTYNQFDQILTYVDALGGVWQAEYDAKGNLTKVISAEGRVKTLEYDSLGQLVKVTDPGGNISQWSYESNGKIASYTLPGGGVYNFGYDSNGINLTAVTDPYGNTTNFSYDANRRLKRTTHPDGNYRETSYDGFAPMGHRNENDDTYSMTRSPSLRPLTVTDYMGNISKFTYTDSGKLKSVTDPAGNVTRHSYNEKGQPSETLNPLGQKIKWNYWGDYDIKSLTLSENPNIEVELSANDYGLTKANGWQFSRDLMGRSSQVITPRDYWERIKLIRDGDGYLVEKKVEAFSSVDDYTVATYSWNDDGTLASTTHALGTDSYNSYNSSGQVVTQTWFTGKSASFDYDLRGQQTQVRYPDGDAADYTYNARGFLTDISWRGESLQFFYDGVGNVTGIQRSNNIETTYIRNGGGQLLGVSHKKGAQDFLTFSCSRNSRGLLLQCTKSSDVLGLKPVFASKTDNAEFTYARSFTLTKFNGNAAITDLNGNQTVIPGSRNFSGNYDVQNLLTSWSANSVTSEAVYDGENRLTRWTRGGVQRNFHYDEGDRLLFETDDAGNLTRQYLYFHKEVVAMYYEGEVHFYHTDQRSNTAFLSDSSGNTVAEYHYMPYGIQKGGRDSTGNLFTFSGRYGVIDLKDDLYYMRSRTYDAATRAFLSNDPTGMGVTLNARSYANNNPINWIDPDGRRAIPGYGGSSGPIFAGPDGASGYRSPPPSSRKKSLRARRGLPPSYDSDACDFDIDWNFWANITAATPLGGVFGNISIFDKYQNGDYNDVAWDVLKSSLKTGPGLFLSFFEGNGGSTPGYDPAGELKSKMDSGELPMPGSQDTGYEGPAIDPQEEIQPEYTYDD